MSTFNFFSLSPPPLPSFLALVFLNIPLSPRPPSPVPPRREIAPHLSKQLADEGRASDEMFATVPLPRRFHLSSCFRAQLARTDRGRGCLLDVGCS